MSLICTEARLTEALQSIHPVSGPAARRLRLWTATLDRWSRAQRLVGWRSGEALLTEGLADAWAAVPLIAGTPADVPLLDVGSGSGLPGLVLAGALPDRAVHLVEPKRKRVAFLRAAVRAMELPEVRVHHGSVEELRGSAERPSRPLLAARAYAASDVVLAEASRWGARYCLLSVAPPSPAIDGWRVVEQAPGRPADRRRHLLLEPASG